MTIQPMSSAEQRRLWALWGGAGLYFLIFLNGLRYLREFPFPIVILGFLFNGAIFTTFIFAIRRTYKKRDSQARMETAKPGPDVVVDADRQRIRLLWLGSGLYFIAMMVGLQYAAKLPPQYLAPAGILNMAIVLTFVVKLRKAYLPKKN
jgi:hypothetical protein